MFHFCKRDPVFCHIQPVVLMFHFFAGAAMAEVQAALRSMRQEGRGRRRCARCGSREAGAVRGDGGENGRRG